MDDKEAEKAYRIMRENQKFFGLSNTFKSFSAFPFSGIDQQSSRTAMDDHSFYWLENYIKTGNGSLRAMRDRGSNLYTVPNSASIEYFYFY